MKQYITLLSYPKSGVTYTARLLGDILNCPIKSNTHGRQKPAIADEGHDRPGNFEIKQWHGTLKGEAENSLYLYVYRDPRDVTLSVRDYWHMDGIDAVIFNENTKPPNPVAPTRGWSLHLETYFHKADSHIAYDMLRKRPEQHLRVILKELGLDQDEYLERIPDAVKRQSIENRKKMIDNNMPYGSKVQENMLRMGGRVGAWKKEWKRYQGEYVHEFWWEWMNLLTLETDEEWYKKLPE